MGKSDINIQSNAQYQTLVTLKEFSILKESNGELKAFIAQSIIDKTYIPYTIKGQTIQQIYLPKDHAIIIFHTASGIIVIDYENVVVENTVWEDYFIEPHSQQLFRKVNANQWHDIEGHVLQPPIFITEDILISLPTKSSKKSISFKSQTLQTNPDYSLIQIGKLVFSSDLNLLNYQGEKITSIRHKQFKLKDNTIQEVGIGKYKTGFIALDTLEPFTIQNELITEHLQSARIANNTFEWFSSDKNKFIINARTNELLTVDDEAIHLSLDNYLLYGDYQLMNGLLAGRPIVFNLKTHSCFNLDQLIPYDITSIDPTIISINDDKVINIQAGHYTYVYSLVHHSIFSVNDGEVIPQKIEVLDVYGDYFAKALVDGTNRLFYIHNSTILSFIDDNIEIQSIDDVKRANLINASDSHQDSVVLDARQGYHDIPLARVAGQLIQKVFEHSHALGIAIVQNAALRGTGGVVNRAIRIDKEDIQIFTIDPNIKSFPDGEQVSVFAGNPIIHVDFDHPIKLGDDEFLPIQFIPYHEVPTKAFINSHSGKVLIVEGESNRHEIVTGIAEKAKVFNLGEHELIEVNTLTEDFKESKILMCRQTKKSSLKFFEDYLPALESFVPSFIESGWEYQLFKLRSSDKQPRYLVAEKQSPYRILVEETKNKIAPKFINSNDKALKEPKRRSNFAKLFLDDPGFLR